MNDEAARSALARLIDERGEDYAGLSRLLGRNPAYVQQYLRRGTPRRLGEADRRRLARYLGVDEALLGGEERPPPADAPVRVPMLDVGASAGGGAEVGAERVRAHAAFDPAWLRRVARGGADRLSIIAVAGDSMLPTLADGDEVLVDAGDGAASLRDGIYVLRLDGALLVKRVAVNPAARTVSILSDNPAYPSFDAVDPGDVAFAGRAIWVGRRLT